MKRFKKFFEDMDLSRYHILNPELEEPLKFEYRNKRAIYVSHALERFNERNKSPMDKVRWFYKKAIDWHIQNQGKYDDYYILLFSRRLNQGMITRWEPDTFNYGKYEKRTNDKHMLITTYLPVGRKDPNYGARTDKPTKLIMLEHKRRNGHISRALSDYLADLMDLTSNRVNEIKRHPEQVFSLFKEFDSVPLTVFVTNSKVWDVDGVILGEVD